MMQRVLLELVLEQHSAFVDLDVSSHNNDWIIASMRAGTTPEHPRLQAIVKSLRVTPETKLTLSSLVRRMEEVVTGLRVRTLGPLPREQRVPRWMIFDAAGEMTVALGDTEWLGLQHGLRSLIKREVPTFLRETIEQSFRTRNVPFETMVLPQGHDSVIVFASHDREVLQQALEHERLYRLPNAEQRLASGVWLGDKLGYPPCCVRRFMATRSHDDVTLFLQLLHHGVPAGTPATLWLHGPLRVVSHAACSLTCAKTQALGEALIRAAHTTPQKAVSWGGVAAFDQCAQGLHLLDETGGYWIVHTHEPQGDSVKSVWRADFQALELVSVQGDLHLKRRGDVWELSLEETTLARAWIVADHRLTHV